MAHAKRLHDVVSEVRLVREELSKKYHNNLDALAKEVRRFARAKGLVFIQRPLANAVGSARRQKPKTERPQGRYAVTKKGRKDKGWAQVGSKHRKRAG